ncbi:MAG TPA: glycoside hydrolase family 172 protein, partial [Ilumatobacteraceae bacterium]|nr:glycoside hydrolase family 172 protein [Ilumatobacteraceae bacterium]
ISFSRSVRVEFTAVPSYYNISYHTYNSAAGVTTYTGSANLSATYRAWKNPATDPKATTGNQTASTGSFDLAAGQSRDLLNVSKTAGSVKSVKLTLPQLKTTQTGNSQTVTDNGRASTGSSTFDADLEAANAGAVLTRRLDYGIADQTADVYVDGVLAGRWLTPGSDPSGGWRDSDFTIPSKLTQGKSRITVRVQFVSAQVDWNEFHYWIRTKRAGGSLVQTDTLDVGETRSESAHKYVIVSQTWTGSRTFTYPAPFTFDAATLDILHRARVQAYWDGVATPSVDVPLGFFFGVGSGGEANLKGLLMGVDSATHSYYNYFPMPFRSAARIVLRNSSAHTIVGAKGVTQYNPTAYSNLNTDSGYFMAQYNREAPTATGKDFIWGNFRSGTGQVVGTLLTVSNAASDAVLEGDERLFIDDSSHNPSIHGTGTEDMFNGGFYFSRGIFTLPVHGAPLRYTDGTNRVTSMYRLELADAIPFEKSLLLKLEHGTNDDTNATYEGAVFAYAKKNKESLVHTDSLQIGSASSRTSHNYTITKQTFSGKFSNDYVGRDVAAVFNGGGRAHRGTSQFRMAINPGNQGVRLSRIMDIGVANQKAAIYVDNALVGTWFSGGVNSYHRAYYDSFEIPASFTSGKSSVTIRVQFVSSAKDWNEYVYDAYAHMNP